MPALDEEETLKILKSLEGKTRFKEKRFRQHVDQQMAQMQQQGHVMPVEDVLAQVCPFFEQEYTKTVAETLEEHDVLEYELEDAIQEYCNKANQDYNEDIDRLTKSIRSIYATFGGDIAEIEKIDKVRGNSTSGRRGGGSEGEGDESVFDIDADPAAAVIEGEKGSLEHFLSVLQDLTDIMGQIVDLFSAKFIEQNGLPTSPKLSEKFTMALMQITENTTQQVLAKHNYSMEDFEACIQEYSNSRELQVAFNNLQMASVMALGRHGISMQPPQ